MRTKKPRRASIDEIRVSRDGETAIIEYADQDIAVVHLRIGPEITDMSDREILDLHNEVIDAEDQLITESDNTVIEIPPGRPQIEYAERSDQWVPRGDVLRCYIEDDENGGPVIHIDNRELSLREFGRLLTTHAGWGMRIAFVPEEWVHEQPEVEVREPEKDEQ